MIIIIANRERRGEECDISLWSGHFYSTVFLLVKYKNVKLLSVSAEKIHIMKLYGRMGADFSVGISADSTDKSTCKVWKVVIFSHSRFYHCLVIKLSEISLKMYSEVVGFWDWSQLRLQLKTSEIWTQAVYLWCFELQFELRADAVCWITALKLCVFFVFECCRHIEYVLCVFSALISCLLSLLRLQMTQQRISGTQQSQQWQKTSSLCVCVQASGTTIIITR